MIEREVKLAAPPGLRLPDLGAIADDIVATAAPGRRFTTTYWDTPDLRLVRWGSTLRFRSGEGWTVKLAGGGGGGAVMSRAEHVFAGTQDRPPDDAVDLVRAFVRDATLAPVTRTRTLRRVVSLCGVDGAPLAEVDDDTVAVLDGRRVVARFREIEVEAVDGAPRDVLAPVVDHLLAAGARSPDPTPKLVRALGPRAKTDPEVVARPLSKDARAGDVVRRAIAASVQRLLRNDPGVRIGEDPEAVHQARVATRRLRSDLRTFAPLLDETWATAVREELRWIADRLGAVRDGDVLLMRLRETAVNLHGVRRSSVGSVIGELERDLAGERARLLAAVREPRYLALLDHLVAAAANPFLSTEADRPAAEALPPLLARPWRKLNEAHRALDDPPGDDQLHQLRIRAKRVRYAAEAVAPILGGRATALARAAADLQDVLGELHDAVVAAGWLRARAGRDTSRAFAVGAMYAVELQRAGERRAEWPTAWRTLRRRRRRISPG